MNLRSALLLLVAATSPVDAFVPSQRGAFAPDSTSTTTSNLLMVSESVQRSLLESRLRYEGKDVPVTTSETALEEPSEPEPVAVPEREPVVAVEKVVIPEPEAEPELVAATAPTAVATSGIADSDPGTRSGEEITTAPANVPTTAEKKAAAAAQRAANREISKKFAAKRAEEGKVKEAEKFESLLARPAELQERAKKVADRVAFSRLLPSAEEVSESASKFSSSIEKFNAREAANKLALRDESNTELVRGAASGIARTAVEGFNTGIELVDSIRADDELKAVVGDALSSAGEATSALIAPDPLDDGDAVASITRKAKVAQVALTSVGIAAYVSLCGLISYSKEGSPVAESASKAAEGFVSAVSAIGALGVRSYDAVADAAEKGAAEAEQAAAEERRLAEKRARAEVEAKKEKEAAATAEEEDPDASSTAEEANNEAVFDEVLKMHEGVKAAVEKENDDGAGVEVASTGDFQRDLLAARLKMESGAKQ